MTYKATTVFVMMREMVNPTTGQTDSHPVAVFTDLETAEGNTEGYNLSMKETGVEGVRFYTTTTMMYE